MFPSPQGVVILLVIGDFLLIVAQALQTGQLRLAAVRHDSLGAEIVDSLDPRESICVALVWRVALCVWGCSRWDGGISGEICF